MKQIKIIKREGKIEVNRQRLFDALAEIPDDDPMCIEIKKWSESPTAKQRGAFKGILVREYSEYTGETLERAERNLKVRYGKVDIDEIDGVKVYVIYSLSVYSKEEMTDLIEGTLDHFEHDCGMVIDFKTKQKFKFDDETGELTEC